jgi:hypothetical protein
MGDPFGLNVTILISLFSFYSPIPSIIKDLSHTKISPQSVPVTADSVFGIKIVLVYLASDFSFEEKSFLSILGA